MTTRPTSGVLFPRKDGNLWYVGSEAYSASLRNRHLMHFDTVGSLPTTDDTPEGLTVTPSGSPTISSTQSTWGGAALDLTNPRSYAVDIGATGEYWTFECWFYVTGTHSSNYGRLFSTSNFELGINHGNKSVWFDTYTATAGFDAEIWAGNNSYTLNTWHHVVVQRSGTTYRMWIDGVHEGSITTNNVPTSDTHNVTWGIGATLSSGQYTNHLKGHIDEVYVTHDNRYSDTSANITVPTGPYSLSSGAGDPNYNDVSLLLHMDGANGSTTFTDSSSNGFTATVNGNAQISTTENKFGGASGYFDGAGDYLQYTGTSELALGSGDFTVEFWFNLSSATGQGSFGEQGIFGCNTASNSRWTVRLQGTSTKLMSWWLNGPGSNTVGTTAIAFNTWYHVALVRSGSGTNNIKLYLNGALESQGTDTYTVPVDDIVIGRTYTNVAGEYFNGYIDDVRITKNVARYTSNFTPPTAAFPNS